LILSLLKRREGCDQTTKMGDHSSEGCDIGEAALQHVSTKPVVSKAGSRRRVDKVGAYKVGAQSKGCELFVC